MFKNLSLRTRIFLFFALIALGSILITIAALWFSYQRLDNQELMSAFINAGLISSFGILGLSTFIWLLFDENIAKAIETITTQLRTHPHSDNSKTLETKSTRYLGDLQPAASAITKQLSENKNLTAENIARKTAQLESEKQQLTNLLSEIPLSVIMVGSNNQILLYDAQSAASFEDYHPLMLGQPMTDYFDKETLNQTIETLKTKTAGTTKTVRLPTSDQALEFKANICLLADNAGYIITLDEKDHGLASRPLTFDFGITEQLADKEHASTKLTDLCFVVFDTETTGLSTKNDDVIQIGAMRIINGKKVNGEIFNHYVDPKRPIPPASTKIHGITDDMVNGAPLLPEVINNFHKFCKNAVLIAHNAPFDLAFLKREQSETLQFNHPVLDTVLLSAIIYGQTNSHTLDALAERLNVQIEKKARHTALGDAIATADIFLKLLPILEAKGIVTLKDVQTEMKKHQRILNIKNN
jgi:DNA polymerase-3 subunit epsilon